MLSLSSVRVMVELQIPQLDILGEKLVAILDTIRADIASAMQDLVTEVEQINAKLGQATTPEEVAAVRQDLATLRESIRNVVPDAPVTT